MDEKMDWIGLDSLLSCVGKRCVVLCCSVFGSYTRTRKRTNPYNKKFKYDKIKELRMGWEIIGKDRKRLPARIDNAVLCCAVL